MASGDGQPRTYSIASDITGGTFRHEQMTVEIEADSAITSVLDYINRDGDTVDVYFTTTLSAPEITALDSLFTNHVPVASSRDFQFWEENTAETTVLETFDTKMSRTAAPLQGGIYRLSWFFEMKVTPSGPLDSQGIGRFRVDDNVKAVVCQTIDMWCAFSGWDRYQGQEGATPVLDLQIRRDPGLGGNDTIEIRKMKLGVEFMG